MTNIAQESSCDEDERDVSVIPWGREHGSADSQSLADVEERLLSEVDSHSGRLLIDLGQTTYVGCGVLDLLLRCDAESNERDIPFALCTLNSRLASVLMATHVDSLRETFPTRRDAIEAMKRPRDEGSCEVPLLRRSDDALSDGN